MIIIAATAVMAADEILILQGVPYSATPDGATYIFSRDMTSSGITLNTTCMIYNGTSYCNATGQVLFFPELNFTTTSTTSTTTTTQATFPLQVEDHGIEWIKLIFT